MSHARTVALVVTLALPLCTCEEKIPEGPKRGQVLSARLRTASGWTRYMQAPDFADRYLLTKVPEEERQFLDNWKVHFRLDVVNTFDETIDGTKWIKVKVTIWPRDQGKWTKTLTFADTTSREPVVLHPGHTYVVSAGDMLVWEQTDEQGASIHRKEPYTMWIIYPRIVDSLMVTDPKSREKTVVPWVYCDTLATVTKDSVVAFEAPLVVKAKAEVQLFREYPPVESEELHLEIFYLFPKGMQRKYWCAEGPFVQGG